ncbi:MAG TPA: hypothetical protein VGD45_10180 [Steroidobacter sp.]|uniref:hypothetical protein n=1 Tax=Steroidobacter sp. TaxID=1978227 RepID=UPI002ED78B0C
MTSRSRSGLMVSMIVVGALLSSASLAQEQAPAAPPRKPLDLRPPNITHLFTSEQLNQILAVTFIREDIEEVQVESERDRSPTDTPNVWPGIAAPFWAVMNPSQAWRIFAPLPPDQTDRLQYVRANVTDAYVLEPAGVPSPHAQ